MMKMLVGIALLGVGVFFNPPPVLQEVADNFATPSPALAEDGEGKTSLLTGELPHFSIVVNIPALELRLFENNSLVKRIPIAVGQARFPTPANKLDYLSHVIWNPSWSPPDSNWAKGAEYTPPGPDNPLGVVKMPLSNAILLHGTNAESSIGTPASHACIRMYNDDARDLAWTLQSNLTPYFDTSLLESYKEHRWKTVAIDLHTSVPVQFIYEPVEINGDELSLHQDLYRRIRNIREMVFEKLGSKGISERDIDSARLDELIQEWKNGTEKVTVLLSELIKQG